LDLQGLAVETWNMGDISLSPAPSLCGDTEATIYAGKMNFEWDFNDDLIHDFI